MKNKIPKSLTPQRLLRPRVRRCFTKAWLDRIKHESLLRWSMMTQPSSTVIKIWTFLPRKLYIWRICREITSERGQEKKGRAILFSPLHPPLLLRFLWPRFISTIDMKILSLRLDKRNGDLACWEKHFLIFARWFAI